jgi:predicted AlkP superfamily phosphohydrolase/phosphomutase
MPPASPKVCVIGLDGATFDVLDRWAEWGGMPNLARLMERSARADLLSTIPPVTGPAWTSMTTGLNPGRHGIFDFVKVRNQGRSQRLVNSRDVLPPRLWDYFEEAGYCVGAYRVPVTYPAQPVKGFMVSGLLTPPRGAHLAHPPEVVDLVREAGRHWLHPLGDHGSYAGRAGELLEADRASLGALKRLTERFDPGFLMCVNSELDHLQHAFWPRCVAAEGPGTDGEGETVRQFFASVDEGIGWLADRLGREGYVFIVSDHGFGPLDGLFDMNEWLARHGYLKLRRGRILRALVRRRVARLAKSLLTRSGLLEPCRAAFRKAGLLPDASAPRPRPNRALLAGLADWPRSVAVLKSASAGGIQLNTDGRSPSPRKLSPGERSELLGKLSADLLAIEDPDTGGPLFTGVWRREEIYDGPYVGDAPDLLIELRHHAVSAVLYAGGNATLVREGSFAGTHRQNGVFLAAGPGIRPGVVPDLSILDVAPTVLHAAGLSVPRYMEGRVRRDLFAEGSAGAGEANYSDVELDLSGAGREPEAVEGEDTSEVERRLRELGYL